MPSKQPWQHDVVQLNNKGLDLIHPIEQVDAEHYSRMEDVKSLQEGTITPRPGTSLVNASALAASSQPVQQGQAVRVHGDGTKSTNHALGAPNYGFVEDRVYLIAIYTETLTSAATVSSLAGGSNTWVLVGKIDFGTIASPKNTLHLFRTKAASTISGTVTYLTDVASSTFFSIHEFTGMDEGGANGADAIVQFATTATDLASGTAVTTTLNAFGSANNATFAAAFSDDGNRTFTITSPMVEIFQSTGGGNVSLLTMFYEGNDTTPGAVIDVARNKAIIAVEIKGA